MVLLLQVLPQLAAALIGRGIAGYFAMQGVKGAIDADREASRLAEEREVNGVLTALYHEMDIVWERYMETMGRILEDLPEGKPLLHYYPVANDYFTFYNANAALIGRIPDGSLRSSIVRTYTLGKGLIDSYKMNNSRARARTGKQRRCIEKATTINRSMATEVR